MKGVTRTIRRRLGPLGLSLAAAAITAAGFAAFSLAADDKGGSDGETARPIPPPPGPHGMILRAHLSEEDRQKMDEFRKCMEDQGAPAPPRFREGEGPPEPPSSEEIDQIRKAHEACQDELPEELRERGFPRMGPCGPPPGAPGRNEQGFVVPAPAPSGAS
jgi:hypothetical protein